MSEDGAATNLPADVPGSVRGLKSSGERWRPVRDRNNQGAVLLRNGETARGAALLREAVELTRRPDVDLPGLEVRARALGNLAAATERGGDLQAALDQIEEAIATGQQVIEQVGDEYGTCAVVLSGHLSRAQTLILLDRLDEASAATDRAEELLPMLDESNRSSGVLQFTLHNVRCGVLFTLGRLQAAEQEVREALRIALATKPELAGHAYANLAAIAQATGDEPGSRDYLGMAEQMHSLGGDASGRQLAVENLARAALQQGRLEEAREQFERAGALAEQAGFTARAAACRYGVAAVWQRSGRLGKAAKVLRAAIAELPAEGASQERMEAYGFLGDVDSMRMRFADAEQAYLAARQHAQGTHQRCRVDIRRAEMHAEWAAVSVAPSKRLARIQQACELAVPALLAVEALREEFPPGPVRERWIAQVAAPARELAFRLARTLGDGQLVHDLILTTAAAVSFDPAESAAIDAGDVVDLAEVSGVQHDRATPLRTALSQWTGEPSIEPTGLPVTGPPDSDDQASRQPLTPAAVAGLLVGAEKSGMFDQPRFGLPPGVRAAPGSPVALQSWITLAEQRYGLRIRSDEVVPAW